jgi:hypothetical protein
MGQPAAKHQRATYADLEIVPPGKVAELIGGVLHVMPRPAPRHARAGGAMQGELFGPFDRGRGGPGGWWILPEPELHFPDPSAPGELDAHMMGITSTRHAELGTEQPGSAAYLFDDFVSAPTFHGPLMNSAMSLLRVPWTLSYSGRYGARRARGSH